jgi:hypothetical protein
MESAEIAKEILVTLIDKSSIFASYQAEDELLPAKRAAKAYKIILEAVREASKGNYSIE